MVIEFITRFSSFLFLSFFLLFALSLVRSASFHIHFTTHCRNGNKICAGIKKIRWDCCEFMIDYIHEPLQKPFSRCNFSLSSTNLHASDSENKFSSFFCLIQSKTDLASVFEVGLPM